MHKPRPHSKLKDVASMAGVSPTAVSRYLSGSITLPQQTAEKIDNAVTTLRYQPNPHARRLSSGRSDTIALVVPDIANMFFAELAAAVEEAATEHGQGLVLCVTANRKDRELDYIERFKHNYADALLFITNHVDDGDLAQAIEQGGRVVVLDEDIASDAVHKIFSDNAEGGALAARHLLEAGHRRLGLIGGPHDLMSARERAGGFCEAVAASGLPVEIIAHHGEYSMATGERSAQELLELEEPPTAIFSCSDYATLGALKAIRRAGKRVPQDLSLVTFDDAGPLEFFDPPLTAIRQDVKAMGRRAVEIALSDNPAGQVAVERLPVELVRRASVAPPPKR